MALNLSPSTHTQPHGTLAAALADAISLCVALRALYYAAVCTLYTCTSSRVTEARGCNNVYTRVQTAQSRVLCTLCMRTTTNYHVLYPWPCMYSTVKVYQRKVQQLGKKPSAGRTTACPGHSHSLPHAPALLQSAMPLGLVRA